MQPWNIEHCTQRGDFDVRSPAAVCALLSLGVNTNPASCAVLSKQGVYLNKWALLHISTTGGIQMGSHSVKFGVNVEYHRVFRVTMAGSYRHEACMRRCIPI
jgi:hypothetical protein